MTVVFYITLARGTALTRVRVAEGDQLPGGWRIVHVEYRLEWDR